MFGLSILLLECFMYFFFPSQRLEYTFCVSHLYLSSYNVTSKDLWWILFQFPGRLMRSHRVPKPSWVCSVAYTPPTHWQLNSNGVVWLHGPVSGHNLQLQCISKTSSWLCMLLLWSSETGMQLCCFQVCPGSGSSLVTFVGCCFYRWNLIDLTCKAGEIHMCKL